VGVAVYTAEEFGGVMFEAPSISQISDGSSPFLEVAIPIDSGSPAFAYKVMQR
jgi:hypothetical protein